LLLLLLLLLLQVLVIDIGNRINVLVPRAERGEYLSFAHLLAHLFCSYAMLSSGGAETSLALEG